MDNKCEHGGACGKLVLVGAAAAGFLIGRYLLPANKPSARVNTTFSLDTPKVGHSFDIEDIGEKKAFCRCWKSKKFPLCDGSHNGHNAATGDNLGPVVVRQKSN